jgi:hypothetical protein
MSVKEPQPLPASTPGIKINSFLSPQTQKLTSRLFFCCISIGLLWITTLDLAINIVQSSIPSPTTQSVIDSCRLAYSQTTQERHNYEVCANIQSEQCRIDFKNSLLREMDRSNLVLDENTEINLQVASHQQTCQYNLDQTMNALAAWGNQKSSSDSRAQSLSYFPSCSLSDRTKVATLIGTILTSDTGPSPKEIKTSSMKSAIEFTQSTSLTIQSLSDYSQTLSRYNQDYLNNHTRVTYPQLTSTFVRDLSSPNVQYLIGTDLNSLSLSKTIKSHMNSLLACLSLNPLAGKCTLLPTSALIEYNNIKTLINSNIVRMKSEIEAVKRYVIRYGWLVRDAIGIANDFFDSVTGCDPDPSLSLSVSLPLFLFLMTLCLSLHFSLLSSATMQWIQRNLIPLSASTLNICKLGSSSVSWCDFQKV